MMTMVAATTTSPSPKMTESTNKSSSSPEAADKDVMRRRASAALAAEMTRQQQQQTTRVADENTTTNTSTTTATMIKDDDPFDIAQCRTQEFCVNISEMMQVFHDTFSEDQLWAIIYQFVTLYRDAILHRSKQQQQQKTQSKLHHHHPHPHRTDSKCVDDGKRNKKQNRRKGKGGRRAVTTKRLERLIAIEVCDSDSECGECSSDIEASDNSDFGSGSVNGGVSTGYDCVSSSSSGTNKHGRRRRRLRRADNVDDVHCDKRVTAEDQMDYLNVPEELSNFRIHKDGSVHVAYDNEDLHAIRAVSQKQILQKLGVIFYKSMDNHLPADEERLMSPPMEKLLYEMISEDDDDEGIEGDLDTKEMNRILEICNNRLSTNSPESHYKAVCRALVTETIDLKIFLQKIKVDGTEKLCISADAQSSRHELDKIGFREWARFWMQVLDDLRRGIRLNKSNYTRAPVEYELTPYEVLMADIRAKNYNLRKIMVNGKIPQPVKNDARAIILEFIRTRPPLRKASERKLAPPVKRCLSMQEELMCSIRKGFKLRPWQTTTIIDEDVAALSSPKRGEVKSGDTNSGSESGAGVVALNAKHNHNNSNSNTVTVADATMTMGAESLTTGTMVDASAATEVAAMNGGMSVGDGGGGDLSYSSTSSSSGTLSRNKQRRIEVDYSLFLDDDALSQASSSCQTDSGVQITKENDQNVHNVPLRRPTNLGKNRDEFVSRRHTIVGCHQDDDDADDDEHIVVIDDYIVDDDVMVEGNRIENGTMGQQSVQFHDERLSMTNSGRNQTIPEESKVFGTASTAAADHSHNIMVGGVGVDGKEETGVAPDADDRLSLTLQEIVHIRSVMTKAELEGLPIEVRIKEDVEKKKVCFLCLKTRFSMFWQWGVQCHICRKTVCNKCSSKMPIPTEHFGNVPVVLLSPSLLNSPNASGTSSPCHTLNPNSSSGGNNKTNRHPTNDVDSFPRSLMERLMRPECDTRNSRWIAGSAPVTPRHQSSVTSTPAGGILSDQMANMTLYQRPEAPSLLMNRSEIITSNGVDGVHSSSLAGNYFRSRGPNSIMTRSMEGPRSLPLQSPARSQYNTLCPQSRFSMLTVEQKENLRGEMKEVCNDCRALVMEIIRSSRQQTRSSARNNRIKNLTLDLTPIYKRC